MDRRTLEPEAVIAEPGCDARRGPRAGRSSPHRRLLAQHRSGELAGAAADRAEQRPLGMVAQRGARGR